MAHALYDRNSKHHKWRLAGLMLSYQAAEEAGIGLTKQAHGRDYAEYETTVLYFQSVQDAPQALSGKQMFEIESASF